MLAFSPPLPCYTPKPCVQCGYLRDSLPLYIEDPEAASKAKAGMVWALACTGKFVWPIPDKGLAKRLHRVKAPTLAIWGREDQLIPLVYAQEFANRIANCRVEIIEKCGHVLQVEQAEETSRLVLDFLLE